ncbi:hypothetical protein [Deinococcus petrolearius]|uniref:Uncharacterized protein n=1 Tax=Deinococcus petrolearius TaxID=1751295 RepID=A0ABW1DGK7_9DEIO
MDKIVGLGLPGLLLLLLIGTSGLAGAAAVTASLALLGGPFGMLGGIAALGILAMISRSVSGYGFENLLRKVVDRLKNQGKSEKDIMEYVNELPVSSDLKQKMRDYLTSAFRGL